MSRLWDDVSNSPAYLRACDYLSRKMRTQNEMRLYLEKKGFGEQADEVIERLNECGLVDDFKYAQLYIEEQSGRYGAAMLRQKLRQRGVSAELIGQALAELDSQDNAIRELAQKYLRYREVDRQKLIRHLLSKGFGYDEIRQALAHEDYWD